MFAKLLFVALLAAVGGANAALAPTFPFQYYGDYKHSLPSRTLKPNFSVDAEPVQVNVYYETRCPDCVDFIGRQLAPAYAQLGDAVLNVTFVPFGKAISIATPWNRTDYVCQHGVEECAGNNLHACYLLNAGASQPQNVTVSFINCQMNPAKWTTDSVRECADQYGIDWHAIEQCAYDQHTYPLYIDVFANATHARQEMVKSVPFITIDGVQRDDALGAKFLQAVCEAYKGNKPAPCNA